MSKEDIFQKLNEVHELRPRCKYIIRIETDYIEEVTQIRDVLRQAIDKWDSYDKEDFVILNISDMSVYELRPEDDNE